MEFWTKATKEDYVEFGMATLTRKRKWKWSRKHPYAHVGIWFAVSLVGWLFFTWASQWHMYAAAGFLLWLSGVGKVFCVLLFVIALFTLLGMVTSKGMYAKKYNPEEPASLLRVDEQGVRTTMQDNSQSLFYAWRHIQSLLISQHLYIFITNSGLGIFVNKQALARADDAFLQSIRAWWPELKVENLL